MSHSRLAAIVIDCLPEHFEDSVAFWAAALGTPAPGRPQPDQRYVHLQRPAGEIEILIQRVERDPGIHLDLVTASVEAETSRLEAHGATRKHQVKSWQVMQDPAGHDFCVVPEST